ncbi:TIGR02302 family protein [Amaricoccus sp.]|uniref:TIGR02302 family protein n=1 Tax=Amaricoccus sp. TaxID=1872485 RepID=UPI001B659C78|nr:TIGR02302 family protein [Amaricoccus sp.]MBP7002855.1 TIGR02302 family protein [Amaricoccus sp.]
MAAGRRTASNHDPAAARIAAAIRRTRAGLALERALRAFWPLASLLAAAWAALAFGLAEAAPRGPLLVATVAAGLAALFLLLRGLRRFRLPTRADAEARLDAGLPGRPLAALADRPALGRDDAGAQAVWAAHVARMRRIASRAAWVRPDLRLARFDRWGLRLMALVALGAALLFARADPIAGLGAAIASAGGDAAAGPSFEAWAEPPAYTGRPTLYLPEAPPDRPLVAPQGTEVTVRAYGDAADFALTQSVAGTPAALAEAAPGIAMARFVIDRSGEVALAEGSRALGAWSFVMQPDAAPEIDLAAPVSRAPTGETQLSYVARDDHGVVAARAEITLDLAATDRLYGLAAEPAPREPLVVDLPLSMSRGSAQEVAETLVEDFSRHPWSGLPVTIRLTAEDAIGQVGTRDGVAAVLPGRRFYNPVAAALVEQRRDLLWTPENARRVAQVLRAVTWRPEGLFQSEKAYLATRIAIRRLDAAIGEDDNAAQIDEVAEMLWKVALLLEEGSLGDAAERLARAQERLREALRNDASDDEIAQLMDELRQATREYMRQLAEEALRDGERQQAEGPPPGQTMTQDQIQQLMDRIQELSEQGRRAEAEALLEMLQQLLENMQMQMAQGGQGGEGQGQQSMQDLGDALREQQGLADDSFEELQRQFREGRGAQQGEGQGQGQQGEGGAQSLADRQQALRELMEQLQRGLPGEAGDGARDALRRAERDMGEAEGALRDGDAAEALDQQAEAIDNLRDGMRKMAQDMRQAEAGSQNGEPGAEGEAQANGRNDPLGRPLGADGATGSNEQMVPEADVGARARGLLDEIRRRSGDQSRPPLELDYLRRLLDRFGAGPLGP